MTATDNLTETDEAFTYNTVENRLTSTDTTSSWDYNQNNELGGYDEVSFEYDANGNTIKKTVGSVVTNYVYNIENRLIEVWNGEPGSGSLIASYYYDPFGRRLWKEVSGVRTHFHYTDEGLIGEYDAAGSELRTYGYKPESTWTTDPLFMEEAGQYYFYHNDHLGTPQKLTSVNGAVVWSALYSSFGEVAVDVAMIENPLRFPGQYFDEETGLHYNWHRYYDPDTGRYVSSDPIGLEGCLNLYAYVENNPIDWIDPKGLVSAGQLEIGNPGSYGSQNTNESMYDECEKEKDPCAGTIIVGGLIYDGCKRLIGEIGLQDPGLLDPTLYIGGFGGALIKRKLSAYGFRIAIHPAHHKFGRLGKLYHIQFNVWKKGVSRSGRPFRIPLPRRK